MSVANRLIKIQERVAAACARAGRDPRDVHVLAVSKMQPLEKIREAASAGQKDFAENYLQESLPKLDALPGVNWHFIGRMQSNKVKTIARRFAWIHSVDRPSLLRELIDAPVNIFFQFNVAEEDSKGGGDRQDVRDMLELLKMQTDAKARAQGLMVMPPLTADAETARPHFQAAREFLRELRAGLSKAERDLHPLNALSMGTSQDFEVAIEEGANWIRIGTDVFGPRGNA
ncbi:MAG TPA: YggS family pyridoxal phosphate-dependent enzyme [Bdellovibrionales bacterium]|nr:YggS family pyridoxal phosphate-dependent enzyme [Bdellovibrionales bacterium]